MILEKLILTMIHRGCQMKVNFLEVKLDLLKFLEPTPVPVDSWARCAVPIYIKKEEPLNYEMPSSLGHL